MNSYLNAEETLRRGSPAQNWLQQGNLNDEKDWSCAFLEYVMENVFID